MSSATHVSGHAAGRASYVADRRTLLTEELQTWLRARVRTGLMADTLCVAHTILPCFCHICHSDLLPPSTYEPLPPPAPYSCGTAQLLALQRSLLLSVLSAAGLDPQDSCWPQRSARVTVARRKTLRHMLTECQPPCNLARAAADGS